MTNIAVNRISNANVYIDGANLMGRAEELELPLLKSKRAPHKGLGMAGTASFWDGFDELKAKIKWASVYAEAFMLSADHLGAHQFQVLGDLMVYQAAGLVQELPLVYLMTASFEDSGKLGFKQHENASAETELTVYHSELYVGGQQIHMYDVMSNQYIAGGQDMLANFRANLGGSGAPAIQGVLGALSGGQL